MTNTVLELNYMTKSKKNEMKESRALYAQLTHAHKYVEIEKKKLQKY